MLHQKAIQKIKEDSFLISQMMYNKQSNSSYEFRRKTSNNKNFILITYDGGSKGFEVFYPEPTMLIDQLLINFNNY